MIASNIHQDNFLSDLEILAIRINEYLELRERLEADDPKLTASLNNAVRSLENTSTIYTTLLEDHDADRVAFEWQLRRDMLTAA